MDFSHDLENKRTFTCNSQVHHHLSIRTPLPFTPSTSRVSLPSIHELGILKPPTSKSPISATVDTSPSLPQTGFANNSEELLSDDQRSSRRRRVSNYQKDELNKIFKHSFFPSTDVRAQLARDLNMTPRAVQIWFQNKRQAWRAKNKPVPSQLGTPYGSGHPYLNPYYDVYQPYSLMPPTKQAIFYHLSDNSR